ncbi:unnamed protein product [Amoebophrya sp. A120]|nr:unnamed protein product [Amoebophrya sp. A120]|eukprot:GSA120T00003740001.1
MQGGPRRVQMSPRDDDQQKKGLQQPQLTVHHHHQPIRPHYLDPPKFPIGVPGGFFNQPPPLHKQEHFTLGLPGGFEFFANKVHIVRGNTISAVDPSHLDYQGPETGYVPAARDIPPVSTYQMNDFFGSSSQNTPTSAEGSSNPYAHYDYQHLGVTQRSSAVVTRGTHNNLERKGKRRASWFF